MLKNLLLIFIMPGCLLSCSSQKPEIQVVCESNNVNNYIIKWETTPAIDGRVKIFVSDNPESFNLANPLTEEDISVGRKVLTLKNSTQNLYFLLSFNDKYTQITGLRAFNLKKVQNFRDEGGYRTLDNKMLKWGMLFRSGNLDSLDASSAKILNKIKFNTQIDFRARELALLSHSSKSSLKLRQYVNLPISGCINQLNADRIYNDEFKRGDAIIYMQNMYRYLALENIDVYRNMFKILLSKENYPLIINCNYGKDYTGFGIALILYAMNVPDQTIIEDYKLTDNYLNKRKIASYAFKLSQHTQEAITTLMQAREEYLDFAFQCIKKEYGTIDRYLEVELEMDKDKREELRNILLY